MANILNCREIFYKFESRRKQRSLEAEAINFWELMDCLNQENLEKLKEAISLSVYKRLVI